MRMCTLDELKLVHNSEPSNVREGIGRMTARTVRAEAPGMRIVSPMTPFADGWCARRIRG